MSLDLNKPHMPAQMKGLKLKRMGIDTHQELILYMNQDNLVCRSEGFAAMSRIRVSTEKNSIVATLNVVTNNLLTPNEIGLSEAAWLALTPHEHDTVCLSHTQPVESFTHVRGKLFGKAFSKTAMHDIIQDIVKGRYSQIQLSAFILSCLNNKLSLDELGALTNAMVQTGDRLVWSNDIVLDKHCVGGIPGNRTTPIIVPIITACGLTMPKTSSRAITSPAGTADTMEVITCVNLSLADLKRVVEQEGGCLAWGGTVNFSPSDDKLIQVERALDLDSEGQMVASILSKKLAAGATHVLIDIPVGPTAKVRQPKFAERLTKRLKAVGQQLNLTVETITTDGTQPVGYGIGPALEMTDILAVLQNKPNAPTDLRDRALLLAGRLLEISQFCNTGEGIPIANDILASGKAWDKFQSICIAQGGLKELPQPICQHEIKSKRDGIISYINNRFLARLAKLAGAPNDQSAGIKFHFRLGDTISKGDTLFTLYAESPGELRYALDFLEAHPDEIRIGDECI